MEFSTKCSHEPGHQPFALPNNFLKPEIDKEFCMDTYQSKGFLQDFQHLDHLSLTESSFNPDLGIHTTGFDPFDPFLNGSSMIDFDFLEFKPFEENESNDKLVVNNFEGGGIFNYDTKDTPLIKVNASLIPLTHRDVKSLNFSVHDESSCITADNGNYKETGMKRNNRISNNGSYSSTNKPGRGQKKPKSAKGQWTIEEDR